MRARWREDLGIEIVWEVVDFAMFEDGLRQEPPQMFLQGGAADYPDPDSFLSQSATGMLSRDCQSLILEA